MRAAAIATALRAIVRAYMHVLKVIPGCVCAALLPGKPPVHQRPLISAVAACTADGQTPEPNFIHALSGSIETKVRVALKFC